MNPPNPIPPFREALRFWWRLGWISFGGPSAQIAVLHGEVVERRRWLDEQVFLRGLSFCTLLPGPEAQQLATYIGWRMHGTLGGVVAGALFVLPGAAVLLALSWIATAGADVPWIGALFDGLRPAVIALVAAALARLAPRALRTPALVALALAAFGLLQYARVPFPALVLGALGLGLAFGGWRPAWFGAPARHAPAEPTPNTQRSSSPWRVLLCCLALWWLPLLALRVWLGPASSALAQGLFFSQAALVTFGGAYTVLPYVAEHAVAAQWLTQPQMMHGLALAETTPGPLILVVQHVGFVGGWNHPGVLPRELSACLCAALSTWVTFVPCFLWILLGAPYVERLAARPQLGAALNAVAAAAVAVIASLFLWFARATLWPASGFESWSALIALIAWLGLWRKWWEAPLLVGACAALGLARHALGA